GRCKHQKCGGGYCGSNNSHRELHNWGRAARLDATAAGDSVVTRTAAVIEVKKCARPGHVRTSLVRGPCTRPPGRSTCDAVDADGEPSRHTTRAASCCR